MVYLAFRVSAYTIIPLVTISLMVSDTSRLIALLMTDGVIVKIPWNRKVPMITFVMEALLTEAPPKRTAATVGNTKASGNCTSV